jgi:ATP-dependent Clp protease, protease subunit
MIHQVSAGFYGQGTDIAIHAAMIARTKARLNRLLADNTGKSVKEVEDASERDNFMIAEEALAFGIVDRIVTKTVSSD